MVCDLARAFRAALTEHVMPFSSPWYSCHGRADTRSSRSVSLNGTSPRQIPGYILMSSGNKYPSKSLSLSVRLFPLCNSFTWTKQNNNKNHTHTHTHQNQLVTTDTQTEGRQLFPSHSRHDCVRLVLRLTPLNGVSWPPVWDSERTGWSFSGWLVINCQQLCDAGYALVRSTRACTMQRRFRRRC